MPSRFLNNITVNDEYTLPPIDGDANQIVQTDGTGQLSFVDLSSINGAASNFVYFDVKNETGLPILKGKGVMAVGTDGNSGHILIDEMVADGSVESKYFLGVLEEDIPNGGFARVISFGQLSQFNTNGQNGETWADGQVLWCDPANNGDFTITEPDGPNVKIAAAFILNSSTNGKIQIRVQANEGIHDMHDTKITSQVDGDVLVWDNTTGVWFNDSTLNVDYTLSRVGIGTDSPQEKLHIYSTGAGPVRAEIESTQATDAILKYTNSIGSYATFLTQSGQFSIYDYNAASHRFYMLTNGNIGIGTTFPSSKLEVAGDTTEALLTLKSSNGGANDSFMRFYDESEGNSYSVGLDSSDEKFKIAYNSDGNSLTTGTRLVLDTSGNVGIGTTSPAQKLHVNGNGYFQNGSLSIGTTSNVIFNYITTLCMVAGSGQIISLGGGPGNINNDVYVGNGDFYVPNGNVGIGTTSPDAKLEVVGQSGVIIDSGSNSAAKLTLIGDGSSYGGGGAIDIIGGSQDYLYYATNIKRSPGTFEAKEEYAMFNHTWAWDGNMGGTQPQPYTSYNFKSQGSSQMVIYNNNVGIGTTSPSEKLEVNGNVRATQFHLASNTQRIRALFGTIYIESTNGAKFQNTSGTLKPVIASAFNTSSDYRLKSNIVPLEGAISRLNQLEVHRFNWNNRLDEPKVDGFIAHEVAPIVPEAVLGEKDGTHPDGTPDYQGIDQAKLVPLLTAALQEAISKIEQLETRIQTLENK